MKDEPLEPASTEEAVEAPRLLPVLVATRDVCPRDSLHAVKVRADGAVWCLVCDEGFFPAMVIWSMLLSVTVS